MWPVTARWSPSATVAAATAEDARAVGLASDRLMPAAVPHHDGCHYSKIALSVHAGLHLVASHWECCHGPLVQWMFPASCSVAQYLCTAHFRLKLPVGSQFTNNIYEPYSHCKLYQVETAAASGRGHTTTKGKRGWHSEKYLHSVEDWLASESSEDALPIRDRVQVFGAATRVALCSCLSHLCHEQKSW
jgi:hypothetical protein